MVYRRAYFIVGMAILLGICVGFGVYAFFMAKYLVPPLSAAKASTTATQKKPVWGSFNVQEGKLVQKVLPKYPALTQEMKQATVGLNVTINEEGKVIDAVVTVGYPLCSEAVKRAVMQWRYTPTLMNGKPVVVQTHVNLPCGNPHGKLHPTIAQLIYRIQGSTVADAAEKNFVNDGLAMLEITFTGSLQQGIEGIKKIGFEVVNESGKSKLIGFMPLERVNELHSLPGIFLVAPHKH
jgi:TonB family protein